MWGPKVNAKQLGFSTGRVRHGYTAGRDFPHCTCTCKYHTRNDAGTVFAGYGYGIYGNPR